MPSLFLINKKTQGFYMSKKLIFLTSIFILCACGCTPANNNKGFASDGYVDEMPAQTENGNIFHAFCWKYSDITANLAAIAESSFKSIQVSPVQQPKNGGATWWSYYQPLSFSIADNSALGTKEELQTLCQEADKYGISIIADIVFNHLANIDDDHLESDGTPTVSPDVEAYEPEIYANRNASGDSATFHHNKNATGSGAETQFYAWGNLPDLNTANPLVQSRSLSLLKECIDVGIDGFRLDAAKHIETPTDPQYPSDFYPNVINAAKEYYKTKNPNQNLYVYGEMLDDPIGRSVDAYLPYIDVTDNKVKSSYVSASIRKDATVLPKTSFSKECDASHIVYWTESHDDYTSGETIASSMQVNKVWAMMTARKGGRGLYFARQANRDSIAIGEVGSYLFEQPSVGAVNRFHNRFINAEENVIANENIYVCERYTEKDAGAVITNLITAALDDEKITATFSKLEDGLYCDQMTGKVVEINNHQATFEMHSSRIAVLTKTKNAPRPYFTISNRGGYFLGSIALELDINDGEGTYQINNEKEVAFNDKTTVNLNSSMAVNKQIILKIKYGNSQFSYEKSYIYTPLSIKEGFFNVLNLKTEYFTNYEIYLWSWGSGSGHWSKDYTVENNVLLINLTTFKDTSFLIALFEKNYVISNLNAWDDHKIKQTGDIAISSKFYDASSF